MKHAREDYDRIQDPAGLIPANEPVFLLRGQDILAPVLLDIWADNLSDHDGDPHMIEIVREHAKSMRSWQDNVKRKIPDLSRPQHTISNELLDKMKFSGVSIINEFLKAKKGTYHDPSIHIALQSFVGWFENSTNESLEVIYEREVPDSKRSCPSSNHDKEQE